MHCRKLVCSLRDQLRCWKNPTCNFIENAVNSLFSVNWQTQIWKSWSLWWLGGEIKYGRKLYGNCQKPHIQSKWERDQFWDHPKKVNTKDHTRTNFKLTPSLNGKQSSNNSRKSLLKWEEDNPPYGFIGSIRPSRRIIRNRYRVLLWHSICPVNWIIIQTLRMDEKEKICFPF